MRILLPLVLLLATLAPPVRGAAEVSEEVENLIERLIAIDPAERERARKRLIEIGPEARPALRAAARSDHPELRAQAQAALAKLPWHLPSDPAAVQAELINFAKGDTSQRTAAITRLTRLNNQAGLDALLRILSGEPSEMFRWQAMLGVLELSLQTDFQKPATFDPPEDNVQALVLAGCLAWIRGDLEKSEAYLQRAVDAQSTAIDPPGPGIAIPFEMLVDQAIMRQDYSRAAELRRRQPLPVAGGQRPTVGPRPLLALMMLHGEYGPLPGFADDLRRSPRALAFPETMHAMARIAHRRVGAPAGWVLRQVALALSAEPMGRYLTANYLAERGWHDEARAEYLRVAQQQDDFLGLSSMLRLAEMEANIGNDRGAIHALEIAHRILTKPQNQRQFMYPESELRAKLEWHHFRLALAAGEPVKADEHLKRLIQFAPKDGAIAMDLNARLKALGKEKEAATLFDFAYQAALARLAEPDEVDEEGRPDPSEMLNNLAWLCARSGEKLDEALRHAQRAVERHPANGAFLDTLAEVYFVRGDNERAARLERLALIFRPGDRFMLGQLQRFESNAR